MKLVLVFAVLIILAVNLVGQNTPTAVKVAELQTGQTDDEFVTAVKGFLTRLSKESKSTTGFITLDEYAVERLKIVNGLLKERPPLIDRVMVTQPGCTYRTHWSATEFWLVPNGTALPYEPFACDYSCPTINVEGPFSIANQHLSVTYTANISGGGQDITITYHWSVTNGKIVSGQNTPSITVRAAANLRPIVAEVTFGGIPKEGNCLRTTSTSTRRQ